MKNGQVKLYNERQVAEIVNSVVDDINWQIGCYNAGYRRGAIFTLCATLLVTSAALVGRYLLKDDTKEEQK